MAFDDLLPLRLDLFDVEETVVDGRPRNVRTRITAGLTALEIADGIGGRVTMRAAPAQIHREGEIIEEADLLLRPPVRIGQELIDRDTGETWEISGKVVRTFRRTELHHHRAPVRRARRALE